MQTSKQANKCVCFCACSCACTCPPPLLDLAFFGLHPPTCQGWPPLVAVASAHLAAVVAVASAHLAAALAAALALASHLGTVLTSKAFCAVSIAGARSARTVPHVVMKGILAYRRTYDLFRRSRPISRFCWKMTRFKQFHTTQFPKTPLNIVPEDSPRNNSRRLPNK